MSDRISEQELGELFMETGHHHHGAYKTADGKDPDWGVLRR